MPIIVRPYVPTNITVHLGLPGSDAENVTVPFLDYIKNVACSEVYPTWHLSALRANILAQVSFALNRVYTEFYPSRGYEFNITSTTAHDQRYIHGRNIFENVAALVDELFTTYIRRQGHIEPLPARFCNGTTSQCDGLSQWGSEDMAQRGHDSVEILRHYYGDDIELVTDAPVQDVQFSYPGYALHPGDTDVHVRAVQFILNRISQAYPAIPKIPLVDGYFDPSTEEAVKTFQKIFDLVQDGIVGRSTWYQLIRIYTGILQLSELASEGQAFFHAQLTYPEQMEYGDRGTNIALLQYLLSILAQFYTNVPAVEIDGSFGAQTRASVRALQQEAGLPQTGVVDRDTWDDLVARFVGIDRTVLMNEEFFPYQTVPAGDIPPGDLQYALSARMGQFPGTILSYGQTDTERRDEV